MPRIYKHARMLCDICGHRYIAVGEAEIEPIHELRAMVVKPFENFECPKCKHMSCDELETGSEDEGEHKLEYADA